MDHRRLQLISRPAAAALALGLAFAPGSASAQWWGDEGLYKNDRYATGLYMNEGLDDDDWFYDSVGENYGAGYGGYNEVSLYEGGEEEEGLSGGYEDYSGYYEEGGLEEEDDWF